MSNIGIAIIATNVPANKTYTAGEVLIFSVQYKNTITVTGVPRLVLTVGSNTRYANYISKTSDTLYFSYGIQLAEI